jgi:hypothetical protein
LSAWSCWPDSTAEHPRALAGLLVDRCPRPLPGRVFCAATLCFQRGVKKQVSKFMRCASQLAVSAHSHISFTRMSEQREWQSG